MQITSIQIIQHAQALLDDATQEARRQAATAAAAAGDVRNIERARRIDSITDEATTAARTLAHLCDTHGDAAAQACIKAALEVFHAALVPLARDTRLASFDADTAARLRAHLDAAPAAVLL
jgi:hypothetical protein